MTTKAKTHQVTVYDFGRGIRRFYNRKTMEFACRMEQMYRSQAPTFGCPDYDPTYYNLDALNEAFEEFVKAELTSGSGLKFDGVRVID